MNEQIRKMKKEIEDKGTKCSKCRWWTRQTFCRGHCFLTQYETNENAHCSQIDCSIQPTAKAKGRYPVEIFVD